MHLWVACCTQLCSCMVGLLLYGKHEVQGRESLHLWWKWEGLLPEGCGVCHGKLEGEATAVAYCIYVGFNRIDYQ